MKSSGMNPAGASPKGGSVRVTLGKPSRRRCAALDVGASSPFKALMGLPRGPCCALARNALSEPIAVACRLRSTTLRRCLADRHPASRRRCCLQMRADRAPVWLGGPVRPPLDARVAPKAWPRTVRPPEGLRFPGALTATLLPRMASGWRLYWLWRDGHRRSAPPALADARPA